MTTKLPSGSAINRRDFVRILVGTSFGAVWWRGCPKLALAQDADSPKDLGASAQAALRQVGIDVPQLAASCKHAALVGADKLVHLIKNTGQFVYVYHFDGSEDFTKTYNLLRHAASVWGMVYVAAAWPDFQEDKHTLIEEALPAADRAMSWLLDKNCSAYAKDSLQFKPIEYSDMAVIHKDGRLELGADALTLLSITELLETELAQHQTNKPYKVHLPWHKRLANTASALANHILRMRTADGGDFVHFMGVGGDVIPDRSEYYSGEALLALFSWTRLALKLDNSAVVGLVPQWFDAAQAVLLNLAKMKYGIDFQAHWMMYAVGAYLAHPLVQGAKKEVDPAILDYKTALYQSVLKDPKYRNGGRATPIAVRTEGLMALLPFVSEEAERAKIIACAAQNVQMQLKWAKADGAIIMGDRSDEVRIDYIQHNIVSFTRLAKVLAPEG